MSSSLKAPCEQRVESHLQALSSLNDEKDLVSISQQGQSEEWWLAAGELAKHDYWFYLRYILQYQWMDPWFHGEVICNFLDKYQEESVLVLIPRGHGKTGMITGPRPSWYLARDPFTTCLVVNAREDKAAKFVRTAAATIASNARYRRAFPETQPSVKWGENGYYVNTSVLVAGDASTERTDPSLQSIGVTGNITGSHYGKMILDDLINYEIAKHANQREAIVPFFGEALNCLDPGEPLTICGTRWWEDDFYGLLEEGQLEGNHGKIHVLKIGYAKPNGDLYWPERTYFDLKGVERRAGWTYEKIETQRKNLGSLFSALYLNSPVPEGGEIFETGMVSLFSKHLFQTEGVYAVGVEAEGQGLAFISYLRGAMRDEHLRFRLKQLDSRIGEEDNRKVPKEERIQAALQDLMESGNFCVRSDLWNMERGVGWEFKKFPKAHDDLIDAIAYLALNVKEPPEGMRPMVSIICDPAFSIANTADYTAIVVGCKYQGKLWVLDAYRFQTNSVSSIAKVLFKLYRKYNVERSSEKGNRGAGRFDTRMTGFGVPSGGGQGPAAYETGRVYASNNFSVFDPTRDLLEEILNDAKNK